MFNPARLSMFVVTILLVSSIYGYSSSKSDNFVTVKDGHLSRSGKRLRLWGVNFCVSVKRQGNDLELSFDRMQDAGFNAVRVNLFYDTFLSGQDRTNSYEVPKSVISSGSEMDKLDQAINIAGQRGMIFWLSFDHNSMRPGDYDIQPDNGTRTEWVEATKSVPSGLFVYIDSRAEAVHKAFARNILEHINPYTGVRYADEPAIGLYEIMNENAFVENLVYGGYWKALPQFCRANVTKRWNQWLTARYKTNRSLQKSWGKLQPGESLQGNNIAFAPVQEDVETRDLQGYVKEYISKDNNAASYSRKRAEDVVRFACDLYTGYNERFTKYIRSLGKPGIGISVVPVTPTGRYGGNLPMYYAASKGDFVSNGVYGFACRPNEVASNDPYYPWRSYLKSRPVEFGQPVDLMRVADKPYLIYEVNDYRPSPFRVEYPMHIATNAIWQDADGAFWFNWDDSGYFPRLSVDEDYQAWLPQPDPTYPNAGLIMVDDEVMLTAIKSASNMFLNGNVTPAKKPLRVRIGNDLLFDMSNKYIGGIHSILRDYAWHSGIHLVYDPNSSTKLPAAIDAKATNLNVGKDIYFDWGNGKGFVRINSQNVRAYTGFTGSSLVIGDTRLTGLNRKFVNVSFASEDGKSLSKSQSVLMTLVSNSQNTGYQFDVTRMKQAFAPGLAEAVIYGGSSPVLVDRLSALVTAPWMKGMSYEKFDFARHCYERGTVNESIKVTAEEPLFYCRLRHPGEQRIIKKILIMGNSLTCHGPSTEALGWGGNWGMAATSQQNDYAHVLHKLISDNQPQYKPELRIMSLYEGAIDAFKLPADFTPDLVIVQGGDNVPQEKVTIELAGKPYGKVLEALRKDNDPLIVCVGDWGGRQNLNSIMRQFALRNGASFVAISHLSTIENRAGSEGHFTNEGVNWHPGDRGMKKIAETIWEALKPLLYK